MDAGAQWSFESGTSLHSHTRHFARETRKLETKLSRMATNSSLSVQSPLNQALMFLPSWKVPLEVNIKTDFRDFFIWVVLEGGIHLRDLRDFRDFDV